MFSCVLIWICIFQAINYTTASTTTYCDRAYLGRLDHGVITSYNYPFHYRHNLTCTHRIHLPQYAIEGATSQICFTFNRFSLETSTPFCFFDHLKIYNTKYCGRGDWQFGSQPTEQMSNVWQKNLCWEVKASYFDLLFNSDSSVSDTGFYATYDVYTNTDVSNTGTTLENYAPCGHDQWTCFNRKCIDSTKLCDNADDCGDSSDETYTHARCGVENVLSCDFSDQGDFSDGYCGLKFERWFRTKDKLQFGPKGDHTNTTAGYYVYTDIDKNSQARLLSQEFTLPSNQTYCLTFWYFMYGSPAEAKLDVFIANEQAYSRPEWSRTRVTESRWLKGQVSFVSQSRLQMIFAAELENNFSGVALDDISILQGACRGDDISCNYESGFCGWSVAREVSHLGGLLRGDTDWRRQRFTEQGIGPPYDNSSSNGSGYYAFMNYTGPSNAPPAYKALLVSPPIQQFQSGKKCLQFHYYMAGRDKSSATIQVKLHLHDNSITHAIWSHQADIRGAWQPANVPINTDVPYQIIIEGSVSRSSLGQIAIDTLLLEDGECPNGGDGSCAVGQFMCTDGACIADSNKCNGVNNCGDASDEAGCPTTTTPTRPPTTTSPTTPRPPPTTTTIYTPSLCEADKFECVRSKECIRQDWLCDGFEDCVDESDEDPQFCNQQGSTIVAPPGCRTGEHRCNTGECVAKCDGNIQCSDQSDEFNCTGGGILCLANEFQCHGSGMCIPETQVCDGQKQCHDASDEAPEYAQCQPAVAPSGLGVGPVIGIALAVLIIIIVIIVAVVFRRRKLKRPLPPRSETGISTISSYDSNGDRHHTGLSAMTDVIRRPPPYNNTAIANSFNMGGQGYDEQQHYPTGHVGLPPDEPPPPYNDNAFSKENNVIDASTPPSEMWPGVHRHTAVRSTLPGPNRHVGVNREQSWRGGSSRHASVPNNNLQSFVSGLQPQPLSGGNIDNLHNQQNNINVNRLQQQPHLVSPYAVRNYVPDPTANVSSNSRDDFISPHNRSGRRSLPRPPGIYPDGPHRIQGRPKLGTTALKQPRRKGGPRNYMNQSATSPHSESYDSDSTAPPDHIYETLNLPSDSDRESQILEHTFDRHRRRSAPHEGRGGLSRDRSNHSVNSVFSGGNPSTSGMNNLNSDNSTSIVQGPISPHMNSPPQNNISGIRPMDYNINGGGTIDRNNRQPNTVGMPYNGSINNQPNMKPPPQQQQPQFISLQFFTPPPALLSTSPNNMSSSSNNGSTSPPSVLNTARDKHINGSNSSSHDSAFMNDSAVAPSSSSYNGSANSNNNSSNNKLHQLPPGNNHIPNNGYRDNVNKNSINPGAHLHGSNSGINSNVNKNSNNSHINSSNNINGKSASQQQQQPINMTPQPNQQNYNGHHLNPHNSGIVGNGVNNHPRDRNHTRNDSALSHDSMLIDQREQQVSTPDSQSHLLPSSNNSSFDQSQHVGLLNGVVGGNARNGGDPNMSGVVFLPDMDETLLNPTSV